MTLTPEQYALVDAIAALPACVCQTDAYSGPNICPVCGFRLEAHQSGGSAMINVARNTAYTTRVHGEWGRIAAAQQALRDAMLELARAEFSHNLTTRGLDGYGAYEVTLRDLPEVVASAELYAGSQLQQDLIALQDMSIPQRSAESASRLAENAAFIAAAKADYGL